MLSKANFTYKSNFFNMLKKKLQVITSTYYLLAKIGNILL